MKLILIYFFFAINCGAAVDLQKANYLYLKEDQEFANSSFSLLSKRKYSSRTLFKGVFGFGWCSLFDLKVTHRNGKVLLKNCSKEFVLNRYKEGEFIEISPMKFANFTSDGRLKTILDSTGQNFTLQYNAFGLLVGVIDSKNDFLKITFDSVGGGIRQLKSKKHTINFDYDRNKLISVSNEIGGTENYQYDDFDNLTSIEFPDGAIEEISYNMLSDQVRKVKRRDGCREEYIFTPFANAKNMRVEATLHCGRNFSRTLVREYLYDKKIFNDVWH